jgi:diguanylate cyclase (GGDEF)-like protein
VVPLGEVAALAEVESEADLRRARTLSHKLDELVSPSPAGLRACLVVMQGRETGRTYELADGVNSLGRSDEVSIPILDPSVSRRHAQVHSSSLGFVIEDLDSTNGLFVNGERLGRRVLRDGDRVQLGSNTVLKFSYQDELEESMQRRLYESATRDALLGIHNKQYFLDSLDAAFAHASRRGRPLSVLMLDVDHFKQVNDGCGHLAGDQVLKAIAALVQPTMRAEDVLARFGGDEFVLLLVESPQEPALLVAERIRQRVESEVVRYERRRIAVTVSAGVATLVHRNHSSAKSLLEAADAALYRAKRQGRNRTVSVGAR